MSKRFSLLLGWSLIGCEYADRSPDAPELRSVVTPEHPLALDNPQQHPVSWPLWGGAFAVGELSIRASLEVSGAAGLVIAGPVEDRVAIELMHVVDTWTLRQTVGGEPVGAQSGALAGELIVELTPGEVQVRGELGELSLSLTEPLGPPGSDAGLYVSLEPEAALTITALAVSQPLPEHPELGPPLRSLAEVRGLDVGVAFDIWPPLHDRTLESLLGQHFNRLAPTEFYWPTTRGEDRDYFFLPADLAVNYALVHRQAITGMFLIWDYALPDWVIEAGADELPQIFDEHITTLVERYRGRVDTWIVVNEAIWGLADTGEPARYAETIWYEALGPDYIERAFTVARAADPAARLILNETGAETPSDKSDFLHALAGELLARGVALDGVGLQFHVDLERPPARADIQTNMERFAALGLSVHVTELDVSLAGADLPEALDRQAAIFVDVLEACLAVPNCSNWTVFGLSDQHAWDELGDARPLLLDANYQPKPAFFAVQSALR